VIACNDVADASRIMSTLAVDAIVVDSHSLESTNLQPTFRKVLEIRQRMSRDDRVPELVVLTSGRCSSEIRGTLSDAAAILLPRQTYRELARLLRRVVGLTGPCCGSNVPVSL
jgi:hypothetical protein